MKPLAIELFCGSFGWASAFAREGWRVVAFDIEHLPHHGPVPEGCELVLQDVQTLHGRQFRNADAILASPPCQGYSARAMPWARLRDAMLLQHMGWEDDGGPPFDQAISNPPIDNTLFRATLRIHREACEAAGRYIPLLIENVKGAQRWIGRSRFNYGSFHLWGDVPALMPQAKALKVSGFNFHQHENGGKGGSFQSAAVNGTKVKGLNWSGSDKPGYKAEAFNITAAKRLRDGQKNDGGSWFAIGSPGQTNVGQNPARMSTKSNARKAASAAIAKIPEPLARHIAQVFKP